MRQRNVDVLRVACATAIAATLVPGSLVAQSSGSRLAGTVRDSLAGTTLAGARIELVPAAARESAGYVASADADGNYRLESVAPGRYVLGFAHPRLDSLGLILAPRLVEVRAAATEIHADLAVPGARELGAVLCGIQRDGTGALFGRVLDADLGAPVEAGTVLIRWGEVQVDSSGVQRVLRGVRARVGTGGRFAACGVPTGVAVLVQARALAATAPGVLEAAPGADSAGRASITEASSDGIEITLDPADPVRFRDILVPSTSLRADAARDSVTLTGGAGRVAVTSRLTGRVFRPDGRPLQGARIRVGGGRNAGYEAITGADGYYMLDGIASGTQSVDVIAIGFRPARRAVDLRSSAPVTLDLRLTEHVDVLDPVAVYAAPARAGSEFAQRQRQGAGVFLTGEQVTRRTSTYLANALVGVGGLRILGTNSSGAPVLGGRFNCQPAAFLDGFRLPEGTAGLDRWIRPAEVGGVEVYPDGINAPPQYSSLGGLVDDQFASTGALLPARRGGPGSTGGCGVLLFWSKQALW